MSWVTRTTKLHCSPVCFNSRALVVTGSLSHADIVTIIDEMKGEFLLKECDSRRIVLTLRLVQMSNRIIVSGSTREKSGAL